MNIDISFAIVELLNEYDDLLYREGTDVLVRCIITLVPYFVKQVTTNDLGRDQA